MDARSDGSRPAENSNSSNSPGLMLTPGSAVQMTVETASVIVTSPCSTGLAKDTFGAEIDQPAWGLTDTCASGQSAGRDTETLVVPAEADSFGTRTVILPNPPRVASVELTVTWADALDASVTASAPRIVVMAPVESERAQMRRNVCMRVPFGGAQRHRAARPDGL